MKSLHLDHINIDHALVRSLPVDIARQYQALPISTDGSQVTVSMAHPEGPDAYRAVISAIGMPSCMFQVNPGQIEHLLAEIWSQNPARIGRGRNPGRSPKWRLRFSGDWGQSLALAAGISGRFDRTDCSTCRPTNFNHQMN